jgi:hypothetical protein
LFERTYPLTFSVLVMVSSITVPLVVFSPAVRHTRRRRRNSGHRDLVPVDGRAVMTPMHNRETT